MSVWHQRESERRLKIVELASERERANDLNISSVSTRLILVKVSVMKRVRHVPKDLNLLQKRRRVEVGKEMLDNVAMKSTVIERINTGDEICIMNMNIFRNCSSSYLLHIFIT